MNIKHYISAAMLAMLGLGFAACDGKNEPDYKPAEAPADAQRVFFAEKSISMIVSDEASEVFVNVYRPENDAAEELTVQILPYFSQAGDDQIFTVDPEVVFPAGKAFAQFSVRYDIQAMTPNQNYTIDLTIDDANADMYGLSSCSLILNNEQMTPWALIKGENEAADGYGYFVVGSPFNGFTLNPVRVFERHVPSEPEKVEYILQGYIPDLEEEEFDPADVEHNDDMDDEDWIEIWHFNTDDGGKTIVLPIQECIFASGISYAEASVLMPSNFKNESKFDPKTGVFSVNVMSFDEEGAWPPAIWTINLDGYADTNVYTLDITDNGQINIADTDYSVIGFNFSKAVNLVEYTIVQLDADSKGLSEEEVAEIAETIQDPEQETYTVESLEASGNVTVTFPASGTFEVVAVGYNLAADGSYVAKITSTCLFKFNTFNPYDGWTVIAEDVTWENNILKGVSGQVPGETVKVNISKNDKFDGYYRIDNPMADCEYIEVFGLNLDDFGSIEFVIEDEMVYFPYSKIGVSESDGAWELASYSYYLLDNDMTVADIPAPLFGSYKDGVISLPESNIADNDGDLIPNFVIFIGKEGYFCNMDFNLNMKGGSSAAAPKKAAKAFNGKLNRNAMKMFGMKKPVFPAHFKATVQPVKKQGKRIALAQYRRR